MGLSEANLLSHHDMSSVQIKDYTLHTCPTLQNPSLNISRVVVYTHKDTVVKERHDLMSNKTSAVWLEVGLPNKRKFLVCNVYREWGYMNQPDKSSNSKEAQFERWSIIIENWLKALNEDKEVIVLGDVNLNSFMWNVEEWKLNGYNRKLKPLNDLLFEKIIPLGVSQLVTVATHEDSCLDHLYTNQADKLSDVAALFNGASDHKLIYAVRRAKAIERNVRYIRKRCFKGFDYAGFKACINSVSWLDLYLSEDVNIAVDMLTKRVTTVLDKFAPVKIIQVRSNYAPWLTDLTKRAIQERNLAQRAALASGDINLTRNYKNLRNKVTNMVRSDKKVWEANKLNHLTNSNRDIWRNAKQMMNWKCGGPPTRLYYNGHLESRPKCLAKIMNEFFISKIEGLKSRLPATKGDPLFYLRRFMHNRTASLTFRPVSPEEVMFIVKNLKNSKSTGLDNIDVTTVKTIAPTILPALTHIVNLSLSTSTFPMMWKKAKVVPLLKKGDNLDPKNYRPVALLPIMSKVLEKAIFVQVMEYIEVNEILHSSHHGSRPWHSTCTAIIEMQNSWINAIERGDLVGVMMLDLSAAFDLVDHELLIQKLQLMGFQETVLQWFTSYLKDRTQCVYLDGQLSDLVPVTTGVPQGSVLGALIYILYVNEVPEVIHDHDMRQDLSGEQFCSCGSLCAYVDDSTCTVSSDNADELSIILSHRYQCLANFFGNNKLVINDEKTRLVVLGTRRQETERQRVQVQAGSSLITPVESEKLLGLTIHQSLKWKTHLMIGRGSLVESLNRRINVIRKVTRWADFKTRLMISNACFMSILSYMIPIWGGAEGYLIKVIQVIQNRAARLVTRQSWYTPTRVLLLQCNWLSIRQMVFFQTALQIWKIKVSEKPGSINAQLEQSTTRSALDGTLKIPPHETALAANAFLVRGPLVWNRIPTEIRKLKTVGSFKKNLRVWVKTNIDVD